MSKTIQVRNVPDEVHRAAAARAAHEGISLSDYVLRHLEQGLPGLGVGETRARPAQVSLRDLARRPPEERHRVLRHAAVVVEADETEAWDTTAGDGLD